MHPSLKATYISIESCDSAAAQCLSDLLSVKEIRPVQEAVHVLMDAKLGKHLHWPSVTAMQQILRNVDTKSEQIKNC